MINNVSTNIVICKGLPASGKSTWSKQYCKENKDAIRVNRDDIRSMFSQSYSKELEKIVMESELLMVLEILKSNRVVVIDDTNLHDYFLNKLLAMLDEYKISYNYVIQDFTNIPVEECIKRDSLRDCPVGKDVIINMYNKYLNKNETN